VMWKQLMECRFVRDNPIHRTQMVETGYVARPLFEAEIESVKLRKLREAE